MSEEGGEGRGETLSQGGGRDGRGGGGVCEGREGACGGRGARGGEGVEGVVVGKGWGKGRGGN